MEALIRAAFPEKCVTATTMAAENGFALVVGKIPEYVSELWWYYTAAHLQLGSFFDPREHVLCRAAKFATAPHAVAVISKAQNGVSIVRVNASPQNASDLLVFTQEAFYALMKRVSPQDRRTSRLWAIVPNERRIVVENADPPVPHQLPAIKRNGMAPFGARLIAVLESAETSEVKIFGLQSGQPRAEQAILANVVQVAFPSINEAAIEAAQLIAEQGYTLRHWQLRTPMRHLPIVEAGNLESFRKKRRELLATQSFKAHGVNRTGLFHNMPADFHAAAQDLYRAIIVEEQYAKEPVEGYLNFVEMADAHGVALTSFL